MFEELLINYITQLVFSVGIIGAFGVVIAFLNKLFYKTVGDSGRHIAMLTGAIGTPVHELGHVFMCLIFRHKIIEVKLFSPDPESGTLGYVKHSFNKKSIYQQIGNFFIGMGPILFGSAVLILFMYLLVPELSENMHATLESIVSTHSIDGLGGFLSLIADLFAQLFMVVFAAHNFGDVFWWVFIVICSSIALHMNISVSDIKTSLMGTIYIAIFLLILDLILIVINSELIYAVTETIFVGSSYVINFLSISILMSIVLLLIAYSLKTIVTLIKKPLKL